MHDGRAGNLRQAQALADALGADTRRDLALHPGLLARWLAPRAWPGLRAPLGAGFQAALADPPAIAVGCGRQAALATRLLRSRGARAVQILDPRIDPAHWDVVIAPQHDGLRGDNVLATLGSLHPVDDLWLARERQALPAACALPSPRLVLLVGGPTRHAPLPDTAFASLLQALAGHVRAHGGSLSVAASRRTPRAWRDLLAGLEPGLPGMRWRDARDGPNPYAGLLAHADAIVCTPDSVNMLSEAAATLAPVHVWEPKRVRGRLRAFVELLQASGRVRPLDAGMGAYPVTPLRETARVAAQVRRRLGIDAGA